MKRLYAAFALTLIIGVLLAGCRAQTDGYGVLLWSSDEDAVPSGTLLQIIDESDISDTYTVTGLENDAESQIPRWRARKFDSRAAAEAFRDELGDLARVYARSERTALPIRAEMSAQSQRIYRMRDQQVVKVIGRSDDVHEVGAYRDHWYNVLTEDGVAGWVFGRYLTVYDYTEGPADPVAAEREELNEFLSATWRPEYFQQMIRDRRYDLERFDLQFGMFPEPENSRVRIVLPDHTAEFTYEDWYRIRDSLWGAEGVPLEIHLRSETEVEALYSHEGNEYSTRFVKVEEDIRELIADEQSRRLELYNEFIDFGERFRSAAYGELQFRPNRTFSWTAYDRLVPRIVSETAGTSGEARFDIYLGPQLQDQYDGALTLDFSGSDDIMHLVYRYVSGGVQFIYVPEALVARGTVQEMPRAPIIMYFSLLDD